MTSADNNHIWQWILDSVYINMSSERDCSTSLLNKHIEFYISEIIVSVKGNMSNKGPITSWKEFICG